MTAASQAAAGVEVPEPAADRTAPNFEVFISHSHVDKTTADATCATLEQAGIRCWMASRDIRPGDEWGAAIVNAIDHCRVMVLIFSSNANNSRQIRREVERAVHAGATIIPLRIEDIAPTEAMAYFMSTVHWLDAMTAPLDRHLQVLTESIKALLQAQAAHAGRAGERDLHQPIPATNDALSERGKNSMFQEIMNFSYQRTTKQAVGWYLMYLLISVVLGFTVEEIASAAAPSTTEAASIGLIAEQLAAISYHIALGVLLMWHRAKSASSVLLVLASIVLAILVGGLGGLIPLAALTRRAAIGSARVHPTRVGFVLAAR
jgi:TIR domain-containing protein